jgi:hypothetical protein
MEVLVGRIICGGKTNHGRRAGSVPAVRAHSKSGVFIIIMLVAPLKLTCPEFHDRNVKSKNNGKGRDEVCLSL